MNESIALRTVQVLGHVPIPVGHRAEVQHFASTEAGAPTPDQELLLQAPIITDLTTGVVYACMVHYDRRGHLRQWLSTPFPERLEPHPTVVFGERIVGKVLSCRIISDARRAGQLEVMTQLKIEPEPGSIPPPA